MEYFFRLLRLNRGVDDDTPIEFDSDSPLSDSISSTQSISSPGSGSSRSGAGSKNSLTLAAQRSELPRVVARDGVDFARTTRGQRLHDLWDDFMRQLSFGGSMTPESTSALNSFSVEYCQQYGPVPEANDCSSSWRRFMPDRFLHETSPRLASCSSSSEGFSSSFSSSFSASGDGGLPSDTVLGLVAMYGEMGRVMSECCRSESCDLFSSPDSSLFTFACVSRVLSVASSYSRIRDLLRHFDILMCVHEVVTSCSRQLSVFSNNPSLLFSSLQEIESNEHFLFISSTLLDSLVLLANFLGFDVHTRLISQNLTSETLRSLVQESRSEWDLALLKMLSNAGIFPLIVESLRRVSCICGIREVPLLSRCRVLLALILGRLVVLETAFENPDFAESMPTRFSANGGVFVLLDAIGWPLRLSKFILFNFSNHPISTSNFVKWNDVICSYNDEFEFQLLLLEATLEYIGTYPSRFRQVFECDVGTRLADFLHFCAFFGSKSLDAAELELLVESTQESKLIDFHMNFSPYEQPLDEFLSQDLPAESTEEFISIEGVSFYGNNVLFRRLFSVLSSFVDLEFRSVLSFELDTKLSQSVLSRSTGCSLAVFAPRDQPFSRTRHKSPEISMTSEYSSGERFSLSSPPSSSSSELIRDASIGRGCVMDVSNDPISLSSSSSDAMKSSGLAEVTPSLFLYMESDSEPPDLVWESMPPEVSLLAFHRHVTRLGDFLSIIQAVFRLFDDQISEKSPICHLYSRRRMRQLPEFQMYCSTLVLKMAHIDSNRIQRMIDLGLLNVFFGSLYYHLRSNLVLPFKEEELIQTLEGIQSISSKWPLIPPTPPSDQQDLIHWILRQMILTFTSNLISYKELYPVNGFRVLANVIRQLGTDTESLSEIGSLLLHVLYSRFHSTFDVFVEMKTSSAVCLALQNLQELLLLDEDYLSMCLHCSTSVPDSHQRKTLLRARDILLHVLLVCSVSLRSFHILCEDTTFVDLLIRFLRDPTMDSLGLKLLERSLSLLPEQRKRKQVTIRFEENVQHLECILSRFVLEFSRIRMNPLEDELRRLFNILSLLRSRMDVAADASSASHTLRGALQAAFRSERSSNGLVALVDMLTIDPASLHGRVTSTHLCVQVLQTLTSIVAGNSTSRKYISEKIGFMELERRILAFQRGELGREVMSAVLDMIMEGRYHQTRCYTIRYWDAIALYFRLFTYCPESDVVRYLDEFYSIVDRSVLNQSSCAMASLIGIILHRLNEDISFAISERLVLILRLIGTHSVTVTEVKQLFQLLKRLASSRRWQLLHLLLDATREMTRKEGPLSFFDFDGRDAGLRLGRSSKRNRRKEEEEDGESCCQVDGFPGKRGYSILFWVRIEDFEDPDQKPGYKPRFLSFLDSNYQGIDIFIDPSRLIQFSIPGGDVSLKVADDMYLEPKRWYHLAFVHLASQRFSFSKSTLYFYVNGELSDSQPLKYPRKLPLILTECCIGTNPESSVAGMYRSSALRGQMGAIHVFDEPLEANTISDVFNLGPNFTLSFQPHEICWTSNRSSAALFDGNLSSHLLLSYNAKAYVDSYTCFDVAMEAYGREVPINASILPGTHLCGTRDIKDIISCMGGIQVLFPLFIQFDLSDSSENEGSNGRSVNIAEEENGIRSYSRMPLTSELVASLLRLIGEFLNFHPNNQVDMSRSHGFQVLGFILKKMSPGVLNRSVTDVLESLLGWVVDNVSLRESLLANLFLDFRLWVYSPRESQVYIGSRLNQMVSVPLPQPGEAWSPFALCHQSLLEMLRPRHILDIMRLYYFYNEESVSIVSHKLVDPSSGVILARRPDISDIVAIRTGLFSFIRKLAREEYDAQDISVIINTLAHTSDRKQLLELADLLLDILHAPKASTYAMYLDECDGAYVLLNLISNGAHKLRIKALLVLSRFLQLNRNARSRYGLQHAFGCVYLTTILLDFPLSESMYDALWSLTLLDIHTRIGSVDRGDLLHTFHLPGALRTLFTLVIEHSLRQAIVFARRKDPESQLLSSSLEMRSSLRTTSGILSHSSETGQPFSPSTDVASSCGPDLDFDVPQEGSMVSSGHFTSNSPIIPLDILPAEQLDQVRSRMKRTFRASTMSRSSQKSRNPSISSNRDVDPFSRSIFDSEGFSNSDDEYLSEDADGEVLETAVSSTSLSTSSIRHQHKESTNSQAARAVARLPPSCLLLSNSPSSSGGGSRLESLKDSSAPKPSYSSLPTRVQESNESLSRASSSPLDSALFSVSVSDRRFSSSSTEEKPIEEVKTEHKSRFDTLSSSPNYAASFSDDDESGFVTARSDDEFSDSHSDPRIPISSRLDIPGAGAAASSISEEFRRFRDVKSPLIASPHSLSDMPGPDDSVVDSYSFSSDFFSDLRVKLAQDTLLLLKASPANCAHLASQFGWQQWLLSLFAAQGYESSVGVGVENTTVLSELTKGIFVVVLYHQLLYEPHGWRSIEWTQTHALLFAERGHLDDVELMRDIFRGLLNSYIADIDNKDSVASKLGSAKSDRVALENFVHFIALVEQFMFYPRVARSSLSLCEDALASECDVSTLSGDWDVYSQSDLANMARFVWDLGMYRSPSGKWLDEDLAAKILTLFDRWNIMSSSDLRELSEDGYTDREGVVPPGGLLRTSLRMICYSVMENAAVFAMCSNRIMKILSRDMEQERDRERFNQLWVVMGEVIEVTEFTNRVIHIFNFVLRAFRIHSAAGFWDIAAQEMNLLREIFKKREPVFQSTLPSESFLCSRSSPLLIKNMDVMRAAELFSHPDWEEEVESYLACITDDVNEKEEIMLDAVTDRRANLVREVEQQTIRYREECGHLALTQAEQVSDNILNIMNSENHRLLDVTLRIQRREREAARHWRDVYREGSNERGPWGQTIDHSNLYWKLDRHEDSARRRRKLKRNYEGSDHAYADNSYGDGTPKTLDTSASNDASTVVSPAIPRKAGGTNMDVLVKLAGETLAVRNITSTLEALENAERMEMMGGFHEMNDVDGEDSLQVALSSSSSSISAPSSSETDAEAELNRKKAEPERQLYDTPCELILPMKSVPGRLEITTRSLRFYPDRDQALLQSEHRDSTNAAVLSRDRSWDIHSLRSVYMRRYRLRRTALEFFFVDGSNVFFDFKKNIRIKVGKAIAQARPSRLEQSSIAPPEEVLRVSKLTQRWQKRQISNFEYLMALNTIAGRTLNDLNQYPVFPWILQDYTSETISLDDTSVYRDLSKPIGALNEDRLRTLLDRAETLIEIGDQIIPRFLYGSHYSSAGTVLYYLVRMEPFTSYNIELQSGKFDRPDRMFDSIGSTWANVVNGPSDFKELIPEFFYLPEFLENVNRLKMGKKQSTGTWLGDVNLPPWSHGSSDEFIRIHRMALESDFVSQRLHEWIDLIFGFKQQGEAADAANNLFYYLTYENAVDIDQLDEIQRTSVIAQIDNFGQTPTQLFRKPHPVRQSWDQIWQPFFSSFRHLYFHYQSEPLHRCKVAYLEYVSSSKGSLSLLTVYANGAYGFHRVGFRDAESLSLIESSRVVDCNISVSGGKPGEKLPSRTLEAASAALLLPPPERVGGSKSTSFRGLASSSISSSASAEAQARISEERMNTASMLRHVLSGGPTSTKLRSSLSERPSSAISFSDDPNAKRSFGHHFVRGFHVSPNSFAFCNDCVFTCGHWDSSFKCIDVNNAALVQSVWRHRDLVTCIDAGSDGKTLVSGSRDSTLAIWNVKPYRSRSLARYGDVVIDLQPRHVLYGHDDEVLCAAISSELDLVFSGSKDGTCNLHTLHSGRFVRCYHPVDSPEIDWISVTDHGYFVIHCKSTFATHLYSINKQEPLASVRMPCAVHAALISRDGLHLVCVGDHPLVFVLSMRDLSSEKVFELPNPESHGTSLALSPDERSLAVGLNSGSIAFFGS